MDERFKIYIDRLRDEETEVLEEVYDPAFMEIHEGELAFKAPIHFHAKASLTDQDLVLTFSAETTATMPCAICNQEAEVKIRIKDFYHLEERSAIQGGVFNFKPLLRETILLELPLIVECHNGDCPERANMAKYMKKKGEEEIFHPFSDL